MITVFQIAGDVSGIHASSVSSDPLLKSHTKLVSQEDNGGNSDDQNNPVYGSLKLSPRKNGKGVVKGSTKQNVKGSTKQNAPVSEVADKDSGNASSSHDPKGNDGSKERISGSFDVSSLAELSKEDAGKNSQSAPPVTTPKVLTFLFLCYSSLYHIVHLLKIFLPDAYI